MNHIKHTESGRSMVEMLGVLAVIGVLSVGAVASYKIAMNKHRASEILNAASLRAISVSSQIESGSSSPSLGNFDYNETIGGATFGSVIKNTDGSGNWEKGTDLKFTLTLSGVSENACAQMNALIEEGSIVQAIADDCSTITYNNDLGNDVTSETEKILSSIVCRGPSGRLGDKLCNYDPNCYEYCFAPGDCEERCEPNSYLSECQETGWVLIKNGTDDCSSEETVDMSLPENFCSNPFASDEEVRCEKISENQYKKIICSSSSWTIAPDLCTDSQCRNCAQYDCVTGNGEYLYNGTTVCSKIGSLYTKEKCECGEDCEMVPVEHTINDEEYYTPYYVDSSCTSEYRCKNPDGNMGQFIYVDDTEMQCTKNGWEISVQEEEE